MRYHSLASSICSTRNALNLLGIHETWQPCRIEDWLGQVNYNNNNNNNNSLLFITPFLNVNNSLRCERCHFFSTSTFHLTRPHPIAVRRKVIFIWFFGVSILAIHVWSPGPQVTRPHCQSSLGSHPRNTRRSPALCVRPPPGGDSWMPRVKDDCRRPYQWLLVSSLLEGNFLESAGLTLGIQTVLLRTHRLAWGECLTDLATKTDNHVWFVHIS